MLWLTCYRDDRFLQGFSLSLSLMYSRLTAPCPSCLAILAPASTPTTGQGPPSPSSPGAYLGSSIREAPGPSCGASSLPLCAWSFPITGFPEALLVCQSRKTLKGATVQREMSELFTKYNFSSRAENNPQEGDWAGPHPFCSLHCAGVPSLLLGWGLESTPHPSTGWLTSHGILLRG